MAGSEVTFGDRMRVTSDPATETTGLAGRTGLILGWTTPSLTGVEVIGESAEDLAYNVGFEEEDGGDAWFAPHLLEVLDHSPGLAVTIGDKRLIRDASGDWQEPRGRRVGRRRK